MLVPGTQMHIATFIFVCIEIVIFFYLVIYKLARPDDRKAYLNIVLIFLLITYNVTHKRQLFKDWDIYWIGNYTMRNLQKHY